MPPYAFFHKEFVPLSEAKVGIMTHALHYGTACFEGIRGNWNAQKKQVYIFRCLDHYRRLHKSSHILKMKIPFTAEELCQITSSLVEKSGFQDDVYIRPVVYKSSEVLGVRLHNLEDDLFIFATPFPAYLDIDKGIKCCISSWRRIDDNVIPARAKITGLYVNSALAKTEAYDNGFDEAIMLTQDGHVSEGSGENVFIVSNGKLLTPPSYDNILMGITRDTVITLAKNELGIETEERPLDRSEMYIADECFLTGTAAHVTPVLDVDHRAIGTGQIGKVTKQIQDLYFDIIRGKNPKYLDWCLPAYSKTVKA